MYERDPPKNPEFIYSHKTLCIYSDIFKHQSPSKFSPSDAIYLLRCFSHNSKQFLNLLILMPFCASSIFSFISSTLERRFPLRTFFIWGNKRKDAQGKIGWIRWVRHGAVPFLVKNCLTLIAVCTGALVNHPSWNGHIKSMCPFFSSKKSLKPNAASHNNASWHTDTDVFLEHSPGRVSLYCMGHAHQKIILGLLGGHPLYMTDFPRGHL